MSSVAVILIINHQMLFQYIYELKKNYPKSLESSDSNVFFWRGLILADWYQDDFCKESDFLNSYCIALSVTENSAQMQKGNNLVIIKANIYLFAVRLLFFSHLFRI